MRPADAAARQHEIEDFDPSDGHLHTCQCESHEPCDCAARLYAVAAELDRLKARIAALLPDPQPIGDDGMIHHGDFSHTQGLQCDECPDYPHASCVNVRHLSNLLGGSE